ncbi:Short-chain dehydrogenase/reductase SDR [Macleaya cordata]|uniref:Short-chain dehydrogenase/reductase SDR n=1 Tax=Macleaya cordata TaxID=56857 RepID=A0A200QUF6_MACCD|nr:Short-chain dehydrogenase/reductase SDR [Macleaya cordata]
MECGATQNPTKILLALLISSKGKLLGGNKGIGLEICRQLASNGIIVVLTARDEERGIRAVEDLKGSGIPDVIFHQLDVKDPTSITSLANFIETHFRKLDILVNNAGDNGLIVEGEAMKALNFRGGNLKDENANLLKGVVEETYERTEECVETNYYGTKRVTEALLPLLQLSNSARIVNVSSIYGQLKFISNEKIKEELNNVDCLTIERIDELMRKFLKDFREGTLKTNGWPVAISAYKVSKAAINAFTRILARKFPTFCINAVHPGLVKTDLSFNRGNLTAEEGAKAPVMLALLPSNGPSGCYFDQMEMSTF